jgi:hypothetical protein
MPKPAKQDLGTIDFPLLKTAKDIKKRIEDGVVIPLTVDTQFNIKLDSVTLKYTKIFLK